MTDDNIILTRFRGRLGNHLWQIMSTMGLAYDNNLTPAFIQPSGENRDDEASPFLKYFPKLEQYFTLEPNYKPEETENVYKDEQIQTRKARLSGNYVGMPVSKKPFEAHAGQHIDGYFQSHAFYYDHLDEIRKDFEINTERLAQEGFDFSLAERVKNGEAILVHFRLGDYAEHDIYHIMDKDYYDKALATLRKQANLPDDFPVIFVTEPDDKNKAFIRENYPEAEIISNSVMQDFYLFTQAKYMVIGNSTFSMMAAILNEQDPLVMQPDKWFKPHAYLDNTDYIYPDFQTIAVKERFTDKIKPARSGDKKMSLDILTTCHPPYLKHLEAHLEALETSLEASGIENGRILLFCPNFSEEADKEKLQEILSKSTYVKAYVTDSRVNVNTARNYLLERTNADWIFVTDSDTVIEQDALLHLKEFVQNAKDPSLAAITGMPSIWKASDSGMYDALNDIIAHAGNIEKINKSSTDELMDFSECDTIAECVDLIRHKLQQFRGESTRTVQGFNMAFSAAFLKEIGGFNSSYASAGDRELATRIRQHQGNVVFLPEMEVLHDYSFTDNDIARRRVHHGRWLQHLREDYPELSQYTPEKIERMRESAENPPAPYNKTDEGKAYFKQITEGIIIGVLDEQQNHTTRVNTGYDWHKTEDSKGITAQNDNFQVMVIDTTREKTFSERMAKTAINRSSGINR